MCAFTLIVLLPKLWRIVTNSKPEGGKTKCMCFTAFCRVEPSQTLDKANPMYGLYPYDANTEGFCAEEGGQRKKMTHLVFSSHYVAV